MKEDGEKGEENEGLKGKWEDRGGREGKGRQ